MTTSVIIEDDAWHGLADATGVVQRAVSAVLTEQSCTVDVLLSNDDEIQTLNKNFRGKDKPTNVLSFPAPVMPLPPGEMAHLGDIVLAFETVAREATDEKKPLPHHVTHLVVHGTLHLLGFDHETEAEAEVMENKERQILAGLGIADPYAS